MGWFNPIWSGGDSDSKHKLTDLSNKFPLRSGAPIRNGWVKLDQNTFKAIQSYFYIIAPFCGTPLMKNGYKRDLWILFLKLTLKLTKVFHLQSTGKESSSIISSYFGSFDSYCIL